MYFHLTDDTKPVVMYSNPTYGMTTEKDTTATSNIGSAAVQSNSAYGQSELETTQC